MSDWKSELGDFLEKKSTRREAPKQDEVEVFISNVVRPSFAQIQVELEKHDRTVNTRISASSAQLTVQVNGADEFVYRLQGRLFPDGIVPYAEIVCRERKGVRLVKHESMLRAGQSYRISDVTMDEVIRHFLTNYMSRISSE
jgi:hypothetical protein